MRRRRGTGLMGTMARTAVIAGTASSVSGRVARNQNARAAAQGEVQEAPSQPNEMDAQLDQLMKLAKMKEAGILTGEEFSAKKSQILGI